MILEINNFLTNDECDYHIKEIKNKQNKISFTNTSSAITDKYQDFDLSTKIYEKLLKSEEFVRNAKDVIRPNNLIMTSMYNSGTNFGLHTDTGLYYNKITKEKSKYTVLIYLNDNFEGGQTVFYTDSFQPLKTITPSRGLCIVFDLDQFHEGLKVISGQKYWIGIELISSF